METIEHPTGNYRFLPGISPYSCGVVASAGYEIVQVTFLTPPSIPLGFDRIEDYLQDIDRPKSALCAISLRSPTPFTFDGFRDFNLGYTQILQEWGLFVKGINPVARTNIAPVLHPPEEPVIYGFAYTQPSPSYSRPTFVVAGAGELPEGVLERQGIVELGNLTFAGLVAKGRFVMDLMEQRLLGLGCRWDDVHRINVYTRHPICEWMPEVILERVGKTSLHGFHWYWSRPPIEEIEFEMDMRGTVTELQLS